MKKDRTKTGPTPKQNKLDDPFFARRVMFSKKQSYDFYEWDKEIDRMRNRTRRQSDE